MTTKTQYFNTHHDLSPEQIEELGREVDAIRDEVFDSRGDRDRAYIRRLIYVQRMLAFSGRVIMLLSLWFLPALGLPFVGWLPLWLTMSVGALVLGLAKILENMEIGHNVMHAQWDWMKDPQIQSSTWEWDFVGPSDQWMHSHNVVHHTWTNVLGKDPDVGYGFLRVTPEQRWEARYLLAPFINILLSLLFQWGVGANDVLHAKLTGAGSQKALLKGFLRKAAAQLRKDYLAWPAFGAVLTAGTAWLVGVDVTAVLLPTAGLLMAGALISNGMRNVWSNLIIFCGHFPDGVHHFSKEEVEGETRAQWYVRQLLGSSNIGGGKLFHIMSGNLSHQIEHHLFPDMPSNRYPEVAPRIQALAARYGLPYNTGTFWRQYSSTTWKIWRLAFPGGGPSVAQ